MTVETRERIAEPKVRVKTVPEVLRHAALVIEERGWCQGDFEDEAGRHCVIGALFDVADGHLATVAHRELVATILPLGAMAFNDAPGRTAAEVTAALRAAADAYESVR